MKHLELYEKWVNTNKEIKNYLVLNSKFRENEFFAIMKVVERFTDDKVNSVMLEREYIFDLKTNKNIEDMPGHVWQYTENYVVENTKYQSDNLQDLIDIKDIIIAEQKYNL